MISKLRYISDLGYYARRQGDDAARLENILEMACEEVDGISSAKLEKWIRTVGFKELDKGMPYKRMKELIEGLSNSSSDT